MIVPFRNAERHVGEAIESLVGQRSSDFYEVVAVDNGSRDRSRSIVESYRSRLPLRLVDATRLPNRSCARNAGVRASRSAILIFVDADDVVEEGYVEALSSALVRYPFVTSRVDSETLNAPWVRGAHGTPWQADGVETFFEFLPAAGANIGIRREVFDQLGGFDEHFVACEDIAFSWTARLQLGLEPHFVRDALYKYRYRHSIADLYCQAVTWGRGQVRLYEHFGSRGMPSRPVEQAWREWCEAASRFARARSRRERAPLAVRLGCCAGRLHESVRRQVFFL